MSTEYKELDPNCTFDELKKWSVSFASWIAERNFIGHSKSSVLITLCVILESLLDNLASETKSHIAEVASSDAMSDEERKRLGSVMNGMLTGERPDDAPTKEELLEINPALGHIFGLLSMMDVSAECSYKLNTLKGLVATTMLTDSNKADALNELGSIFGLDELDDDTRRQLHNHLKGGTTDPIPEVTDKDIDDACDNLFG